MRICRSRFFLLFSAFLSCFSRDAALHRLVLERGRGGEGEVERGREEREGGGER